LNSRDFLGNIKIAASSNFVFVKRLDAAKHTMNFENFGDFKINEIYSFALYKKYTV